MKLIEAENIAKNYVESKFPEHVIFSKNEASECFVFYHQNLDFVRSNIVSDMSIDIGPIYVRKKDGKVFNTGSGMNEEIAIESFKRFGNPYYTINWNKSVLTSMTDSIKINTELSEFFKRILGLKSKDLFDLINELNLGKSIELNEEITEDDETCLTKNGIKVEYEWLVIPNYKDQVTSS